jgi:hypothetical protein
VKFVEPPQGSKPGDRVAFDGLPTEPPASAKQVEKKKLAETVERLNVCCVYCVPPLPLPRIRSSLLEIA